MNVIRSAQTSLPDYYPMRDSQPHLSAFVRARALLDNALHATPTADVRAGRCAALLRAAWPKATVCVCRIGDITVALDADGLACAPPSGLRDKKLVVATLAFAGETFGRFAVELANANPDDALHLELLASEAASTLAAEGRQATASPEDAAERNWLIRLGEVAGPVTHEVNNFLNTLLLQIAVLELTAPDLVRAELAAIRSQGKSMAALIRLLQQYRRKNRAAPQAVDVNAIIRVAAAGATLELADELPTVIGHPADVERLVDFLLGGAAALADGRIVVRTVPTDKSVVLTVEVVGGTNPGRFASVTEGPAIAVNEPQALELAACHSLTRRLNGALRTSGTAVVVELPIA